MPRSSGVAPWPPTLKRRTPPGSSRAQSSAAPPSRSNARATAASVSVSDHQRSPVRRAQVDGAGAGGVAHHAHEHLGLVELLDRRGDHLAPAPGGVRLLAPGAHRRAAEQPAGREHAPDAAVEPELVLDDQVRDVVRQLALAEAVVGAAVELDLDAVGAVQDRAVAPRGDP